MRNYSIVRNKGNGESDAGDIGSELKSNLNDDLDALFKLPLAEFIGARNDLAARLKRSGRANDANLVKAVAKPSVSAWAVNQLHWNHREEFDHLLAAGQRFRLAQASRTAVTMADMRGSLEARREALSQLSELATALLRDAGHNPTPDLIQRVTTTLEALSAYASLSDGPTPGRLTRDLDPPGFESLASLMPGATTTTANEELTPVAPSQGAGNAATETWEEGSPIGDAPKVAQLEETRKARIAAAKISLQHAELLLSEATARAQRLDAAQRKAYAEANEAEKELRELEDRLKKASTASVDAAERSQSIAAEANEAANAVEDAQCNLEKASKDLESLL
ncbi:MAG: hypothetical protein ACREDR_02395 [Blastocatellia bacterium]